MAIITISRGSLGHARALAEAIVEKLGYRYLSRTQLLEKVSTQYGVPGKRLAEAFDLKPVFFDRLHISRRHYLAFVTAELAKEAKDDNLVYQGHLGQLMLKTVPHLLRVGVFSDVEARIRYRMDSQHVDRKTAERDAKEMSKRRLEWIKALFGVDWRDPQLYDLIVNCERTSIFAACEGICQVAVAGFRTTPESQKMMNDFVLSSEVRARIAASKDIADEDIKVEADGDIVTISGMAYTSNEEDAIRVVAQQTPGVKDVRSKMRVLPSNPSDIFRS